MSDNHVSIKDIVKYTPQYVQYFSNNNKRKEMSLSVNYKELQISQLEVAEYVTHTLFDLLVERCVSTPDMLYRAVECLRVSFRNDKYFVIMGFEAFEALKRLGIESVHVRVDTFDSVEEEESLYIHLCESDVDGLRIDFEDYSQRAISDDIIRFCQSITADSKPEYVLLRAEDNCSQGICYDNVNRKIRSNSGRMLLGWQIERIRNICLRAIFHAIWVTDTGKKVDITPTGHYVTGVFLPDSSFTAPPPADMPISEIYQGKYMALTSSPLAAEYINLLKKEDVLVSRSSIEQGTIIESEAELSKVRDKIEDIAAIFRQHVGRNEPCTCQSGLKSKKCCGIYN